jgi:hypothetical protein
MIFLNACLELEGTYALQRRGWHVGWKVCPFPIQVVGLDFSPRATGFTGHNTVGAASNQPSSTRTNAPERPNYLVGFRCRQPMRVATEVTWLFQDPY